MHVAFYRPKILEPHQKNIEPSQKKLNSHNLLYLHSFVTQANQVPTQPTQFSRFAITDSVNPFKTKLVFIWGMDFT